MDKSNTEAKINNDDDERKFRIKAGAFLATVTGVSAIIGFGTTLATVKKKDPTSFNKGVVPSHAFAESGASLALRALGWGTLYALGGCSLLCYGIWKLSGAHDLKEFRVIVGSKLPRIPRNDPPVGRTEFESFSELLRYVIGESEKEKASETKKH